MSPYAPPRRSLTDYALPFLIIVAVGIIIALSFNLWNQFSGGATKLTAISEPATVTVTVTAGEVEAYLPASGAWKIIGETGTTLSEGERVRTGTNAGATVTLSGGSRVVLAPASEIGFTELRSALGRATAMLTLARGSAFFDLTTGNDTLTLVHRLAKFSDIDGAFLATTDATGAALDASAVRGSFTATVLDPAEGARKTDLKNVIIEAGKTLSLSEKKINLIRIGGEIEIVKATSEEITSSPLYVAQAARLVSAATTTPSATATTTSGTTTTVPTETITPPTKTSTPTSTTPTPVTPTTVPSAAETFAVTPTTLLAAPTVSSPKNGATVMTEPVAFTGTVGSSATKVFVAANGGTPYQLTKFVAGSGTWTYRASTTLGNLVTGTNTFAITAEAADGTKSAPSTVTVIFQKAATSSETITTPATATTTTTRPTTSTDGVPTITSDSFGKPVITTPVDGASFTAGPIVFRGTVPVGTTAIAVNGYTLTKFTAGQTTWYYTADEKYENLKSGTNTYDVTVTGPNGETSTASVTITYTPATTATTEQ